MCKFTLRGIRRSAGILRLYRRTNWISNLHDAICIVGSFSDLKKGGGNQFLLLLKECKTISNMFWTVCKSYPIWRQVLCVTVWTSGSALCSLFSEMYLPGVETVLQLHMICISVCVSLTEGNIIFFRHSIKKGLEKGIVQFMGFYTVS